LERKAKHRVRFSVETLLTIALAFVRIQALLAVGFSAAVMPVLMDPNNALAVDTNGGIGNANLVSGELLNARLEFVSSVYQCLQYSYD
jgi:hypothetical protein